ncbi:MAG: hypothetical protein NTX82_02115 [Candidatus Parcubacteria bacterium]|nr:hypothetical protein [Candidatus Parcubacteria bacterium]
MDESVTEAYSQGRGKIMIIHEGVISYPAKKLSAEETLRIHQPPDTADPLWHKLQQWAILNELNASQMLHNFFCHGKNFGYEDWGYNEFLLEFHRKHPGIINHCLEPAGADNTYYDIQLYGRNDDDPNLSDEEQCIQNRLRGWAIRRASCIFRDKLLYDLIKRISKEEPKMYFIVPRGRGHLGIMELIDQKIFDLNYFLSDGDATLHDHFITYPYEKPIASEMALAYAKLDYIFRHRIFVRTEKRLQQMPQQRLLYIPNAEQDNKQEITLEQIFNEFPELSKHIWLNPILKDQTK